ncbi:TPA: conjugal transfer protein TraC [Escherichia coli]|nr:conjugal transfer protein TraC [Escherichia coli]HAX4856338.1 conjugal transfer protein TraC [Escherichia coli]HAX4916440.1 conjugal transfer protein TraC [Escherichia coli]HAX4948681.1 conjugal transfer protein TraC [Escherichia coli]HAX5171893.1 conjugal transfer protein TraC [Escherichia coli]
MNTTEHPVRQLLWCALNVLRAAQENHGINSESGLRRYLLEWLSGAGRHLEFRDIPEEIMALKALAEQNRDIPIPGTLNTPFLTSSTVGECPLGRLQKAGWRATVCPRTERVFSESIELACTGGRHLLQLSRTEACFIPSGQMCAPVSLLPITSLHNKTLQLLETAENVLAEEGFQVVAGYEHQFGIEGREILFHTLFIGLPEDVWGVRPEQSIVPANSY